MINLIAVILLVGCITSESGGDEAETGSNEVKKEITLEEPVNQININHPNNYGSITNFVG